MASLELKIPPLLVTVLFACVMTVAAFATNALAIDATALTWLGCATIMLGLFVCMSGVVAFRRARTTVDPTQPDNASALVRSGIYRWTRNPMYLGFLLLLVGLALLLGSWVALLVSLGFVAYLNRFQIEPEERALSAIFGSEFDAFRRDVRRWI